MEDTLNFISTVNTVANRMYKISTNGLLVTGGFAFVHVEANNTCLLPREEHFTTGAPGKP